MSNLIISLLLVTSLLLLHQLGEGHLGHRFVSLHAYQIQHPCTAHHRSGKNILSFHGNKYFHSRVAYYANSSATFQLLLLAGDVHQNPGPRQECAHCTKPIYNK